MPIEQSRLYELVRASRAIVLDYQATLVEISQLSAQVRSGIISPEEFFRKLSMLTGETPNIIKQIALVELEEYKYRVTAKKNESVKKYLRRKRAGETSFESVLRRQSTSDEASFPRVERTFGGLEDIGQDSAAELAFGISPAASSITSDFASLGLVSEEKSIMDMTPEEAAERAREILARKEKERKDAGL